MSTAYHVSTVNEVFFQPLDHPLIPAPVEVVWERTQEPARHVGDELVGGVHPLDLRRRLADDHRAAPRADSSAASTSAMTRSGGRLPSMARNVDRAE